MDHARRRTRRAEHCDLPRGLFRQEPVVRCQYRDIFAVRSGYAGIQRRRYATILFRYDLEIYFIFSANLLDYRERIIGRSIIDHDQLDVAIGLRQDTANGALDILIVIVGGDDHTDQGMLRIGHG